MATRKSLIKNSFKYIKTRVYYNEQPEKLEKMKRIYPSLIFAAFVLLNFSCKQGSKQANEENTDRPNIIFIVSEDNSPFLGCYGDANALTPNIDKLASEGILYTNAFAVAPVCAPSRSSIITGMYANSLGSQHMRSLVSIPEEFRFFPYYLQQAGYYTVNRQKKDYNIVDQPGVWDKDDWWAYTDMLEKRQEGQPFFAMFNTFMTHESKIHGDREKDMLPYYRDAAIAAQTGKPASDERLASFNYMHQPGSVPVAPYHPNTPEIEADWARYYDCMSMMDDEVGELLSNLDKDGHLENTIVFYFSDHGGVLGRSKRFVFESGLHVPLVVWFPDKFRHLSPASAGSILDRVVTLVDLAPTVLNLAKVEIPEQFQGHAFLGKNSEQEQNYAFGFRGRMDERYDFSRTVRSNKFRYIRNYMPHRAWGQHVNYLWRAASMQSWEEAFASGKCNEYQSSFWGQKPAEELYDIETDPHNIHNLAGDIQYRDVLKEHSKALDEWMLGINDKNFIPEGEYLTHVADTNGYDFYRDDNYDIKRIKEIADVAIKGNPDNLDKLKTALKDTNQVVRYWGAQGCCILGSKASELKNLLLESLNDRSPDVQIACAEALYLMGEKKAAKSALKEVLVLDNNLPADALERIRLHALNVITLMNADDILFFKDEINSIRNKDGNYDKWVAEYLIDILK
jgi:N-sulfoglucosamine sulfohydrolase